MESARSSYVQFFLCGDVMTGRGIDQVLPHPSPPAIYERFQGLATDYVQLAEDRNGPISRPVDFSYVWGEALAEIDAHAPDLRIVNLETSITTSPEALPKGINYRMHPANSPVLAAARIDCCSLANNHVMDWGVAGLLETVSTLRNDGIAVAGAGWNAWEAARPAILETSERVRVLVFAFAVPSSGVPGDWEATASWPGVHLLHDLSAGTAARVCGEIARQRRDEDLVVVSVHWGENWGYNIPAAQREFAHRLIDSGCVDVVHGHSSHHAKGIEVHNGHPILYGCGDFINDYEGITGYEEFRSDLVLAYFVTIEMPARRLQQLVMVPFQSRRFRLCRVADDDAEWLQSALDRECARIGTRVDFAEDGVLSLRW